MNTRRHPARTTLSCLACLALAGSDVHPTPSRASASALDRCAELDESASAEHDPVQAALDAAIGAAQRAGRTCGEAAQDASGRSARRILELAERGGSALDPRVAALLAECAPFLEHLPLERLVRVELIGGATRGNERFGSGEDACELCLRFDVPECGVLEVEVPEVEQVALATCDEDVDGGSSRGGVPVRVRSEARTLRLHELLRLEFDDGRIVGVRDGDLEVSVGPFDVDLELRTERGTHVARDGRGRVLLELDAAGLPRRENGAWVPQTYDLWIVLEALGQRVEVGVPASSRAR